VSVRTSLPPCRSMTSKVPRPTPSRTTTPSPRASSRRSRRAARAFRGRERARRAPLQRSAIPRALPSRAPRTRRRPLGRRGPLLPPAATAQRSRSWWPRTRGSPTTNPQPVRSSRHERRRFLLGQVPRPCIRRRRAHSLVSRLPDAPCRRPRDRLQTSPRAPPRGRWAARRAGFLGVVAERFGEPAPRSRFGSIQTHPTAVQQTSSREDFGRALRRSTRARA
jgi:hypothetical protein